MHRRCFKDTLAARQLQAFRVRIGAGSHLRALQRRWVDDFGKEPRDWFSARLDDCRLMDAVIPRVKWDSALR
jgi:hypothetical protein